jgi:plasmid maintenance system antidote protein VapI
MPGAFRKEDRMERKVVDGYESVCVEEAAALLGVKRNRVMVLHKEERLLGERVDGRLWLRMEDIGRWRERQAHYRSRAPRKRRTPVCMWRGEKRGKRGDYKEPEVLGAHYRITLTQAAEMLNVTKTRMVQLARIHALDSVRAVCPADVLAKRAVSPHGRPQRWFLLGEVTLLELRREREAAGRGVHPATWTGDLRLPVVRSTVEAPANDRLITKEEAAELLGVKPGTVLRLVKRARLFAWQKQPNRPGSRKWFSEAQVLRYRDRPERLKGRAAWELGMGRARMKDEGGRMKHRLDEEDEDYEEPTNVVGLVKRGAVWVSARAEEPAGMKPEHRRWMEEVGMGHLIEDAGGRCWERRHGDYYSSKQTAEVLGVPKLAVKRLRESGRLTGYKMPPHKGAGGGNRWWLYRKEEVLALLSNEAYLKRRAACRAGYLRMRDA